MKIGVYVGSFNPVHKGHIKIVKHLIKNKYLDKVIIVPTGAYWYKQNLIDIIDRINMLKFYENDNIIIDDKNNNLPYTYQLLDILSKEYSNDDLYLIMGADNIINFDKWKNYKEILKHKLIIINRDDIDINYYLNKHNIKNSIIVNDLPEIDISSTMIRDLITENKYNKLTNFIDEVIINYIQTKNLYK